jgi:uncharacterized membrane protein
VTIILFALVMGVLWGTWFSLGRTMDELSAATYVAVGHEMIQNLAVPMRILLPVTLLSGIVTVALLWSAGRSPALWWQLAGLLLMAGVLAVTVVVLVPIDNQTRAWTVATLPADWRSAQSRWQVFHTVRTFLSVAALVAVAISAVSPTRRATRVRAGLPRTSASARLPGSGVRG